MGPNQLELESRQCNRRQHGLRTPREEIVFTARPKTQSQSQIFRYGGRLFCLPHRPYFSDISDLCLHWVSVVRGSKQTKVRSYFGLCSPRLMDLCFNIFQFWTQNSLKSYLSFKTTCLFFKSNESQPK